MVCFVYHRYCYDKQLTGQNLANGHVDNVLDPINVAPIYNTDRRPPAKVVSEYARSDLP